MSKAGSLKKVELVSWVRELRYEKRELLGLLREFYIEDAGILRHSNPDLHIRIAEMLRRKR